MKWKRIERNHYQLAGANHTASIYRDPGKGFWWWGIVGRPLEYKKALTKEYAKFYAGMELRKLEG